LQLFFLHTIVYTNLFKKNNQRFTKENKSNKQVAKYFPGHKNLLLFRFDTVVSQFFYSNVPIIEQIAIFKQGILTIFVSD